MPALAACLLTCLVSGSLPAWGVDDLRQPDSLYQQPSPSTTGSATTIQAFVDDASMDGGIYSIYRNRIRYNPKRGSYERNLDHTSVQAGGGLSSGYAFGIIGLEAGGYASADLRTKGAVDHEINFFPWSTPYTPERDKSWTNNGASYYKAHLKMRGEAVWGKVGYFQPTGPGVLGVNWSFFPGTYRGVEAGGTWGKLDIAAAWADAYKAPWYKDSYGFRKNDQTTKVPWIGSLGARYRFANNCTAELAYGTSKTYLHNAHLKAETKVRTSGNATITGGYHLYTMWDNKNKKNDSNDLFAGLARQHFLFSEYTDGVWTLRLEGTWTQARQDHEKQLGYFAYRLTVPTGSSKGAYDVWWDARSDWNANNEKAVFIGLSRSLEDLYLPGVTASIGYAYGFDGKGYGISEHLKESAWTAEIAYTCSTGWLQGAWIKAHYTHYDNHSGQPSWVGYKNAFQDEQDIKVLAGIPFGL